MEKNSQIQRRDFIKSISAAAIGATALTVSGCSTAVNTSASSKQSLIQKGDTILFQGDSITDASRDRKSQDIPNDHRTMGRGYALLATTQLLAERPNEGLKVYNRGNSGFKVFQLASTWDKNCLSIKPDVLSILIGVNDIWHTLNGKYDGTVEKYEKDYRDLLKRTLNELPKVKLVICEPFVLRCGAVNDKWFPEFDHYRAVAKMMADEFNASFVPFQTMFDQALEKAPPAYWAKDGVHPSLAGAYLMAQEWLKVVGVG